MIYDAIREAIEEAKCRGITPKLIVLGPVKFDLYCEWIQCDCLGTGFIVDTVPPSNMTTRANGLPESTFCGVPIRRGTQPGIVIS